MTKQRKSIKIRIKSVLQTKKSDLLTTTFRSWDSKEKGWALALKSDDTPEKTHSMIKSRIATNDHDLYVE